MEVKREDAPLLEMERELDSLSEELLNSYQEINLLYTISEKLCLMMDQREIAQFILDEVLQKIPARVAVIMLLNHNKNEGTIQAVKGLPPELQESNSSRLNESLVQGMLSISEALLINDPMAPPPFKEQTLPLPSAPLLVMPIKFEQEVMGTIILSEKINGKNVFTSGDLRLVSAIASQVSIANKRGYLFEEIKRSEKEREEVLQQLFQAQKMEAVGRLAGGVAHDFNNLLGVIMGYSEVMLREINTADPLRRYGEGIKKAAERAATLTKQLLAFSRKQILQLQVLSLNEVVGDIEKMLLRLIGEDIDFTLILDAALGAVKADRGQLDQVLMNLVVNARDAMPQGGKLTIETANVHITETHAQRHLGVAPGPYVMLAVSDTGEGMDPETQARIFEPFFTTKEPGKGTGLGLSTVFGIVKMSAGFIEVDSEPGRGTNLKIYLPQVEEAPTPIKKQKVSTPLLKGIETILVVEDEDMLREFICEVLRLHGYSVLEAQHGSEALQTCERHQGPIHLIIADVVLPQMSGRELAQRLTVLHPEIKILYMSGYTDNAIVHHGVLDAEVAFLQKPFSIDALTSKLREMLAA